MTKPWDPLTGMPDLHGKVAVVTGGNGGIGLVMVKMLALRGAKTLQAECLEIKQENVHWLALDLMDLKSITTAAVELKEKERKVDILINNAGAGTSATDLVSYGWEHNMTVNFIGPLVFTNRVLPLLKNAASEADSDIRIVTLSSIAQSDLLPSNFKFQFVAPTALSNPVPSYPWQWTYIGRSVFGFDMIRILSIAVHPGAVATDAALAASPVPLRSLARRAFLTIEQGVVTPLFAATAKEVREHTEKYNGKFLIPFGEIGVPNPVVQDEAQVKGLLDITSREVNEHLTSNNLPPLQAW
ncbi:hypothetical protein BKA66DRAFT_562513 [Pyrenochaeta sp. MPI-SDFR-AT-0127]|nr:hypothetical protein BKA66DRAFT_562513 [Pyrenochaeta sp. MPI-SDFR-AT-0127]